MRIPVRASYYPYARTAHIERLQESHSDLLLYTNVRADWDISIADDPRSVRRVGVMDVAKSLYRGEFLVLEVPEPLAIKLMPQLVILALIHRLTPARRRPKMVTYAIENLDQIEKLATKVRSHGIATAALRVSLAVVLPRLDRVAFGTTGAFETYRDNLGPRLWSLLVRRSKIGMFEALPTARRRIPTGWRAPKSLVFLGTFELRKGFPDLLRSWPEVVRQIPDATLTIIGKGDPQEVENAQRWAKCAKNVVLRLDPPRSDIFEVLSESSVLVLPSRRTPTWREQVGLPILEALERGCTIVTTEETGIAEWLQANGHRVIGGDYDDSSLERALVGALREPVPPEQVWESLPSVDQRRAADLWMFGGA